KVVNGRLVMRREGEGINSSCAKTCPPPEISNSEVKMIEKILEAPENKKGADLVFLQQRIVRFGFAFLNSCAGHVSIPVQHLKITILCCSYKPIIKFINSKIAALHLLKILDRHGCIGSI